MLRFFLKPSPIIRCAITVQNKLLCSRTISDKPTVPNHADIPIIDVNDQVELPIPEYPFKINEPLEQRKQRLIYQSRKRGMLENDLILSTFASKYLPSMTTEQTIMYDKLINGVSNDWDIYYWATNAKPTPSEFDNEIMDKLKIHVKNEHKEKRLCQPQL